MTIRPIGQISLAKLVGLTMATLMIAAVACSSGDKSSETASDDSG